MSGTLGRASSPHAEGTSRSYNGCPWGSDTCRYAVDNRHVETLRWARENGCPWDAATRDRAAAELGYTDDLGNLVG